MSPVHRATCYRCGVGVGCARAGQREAGLSIIGAIIPPWRGVPSATSADRTPRSLDRSMGNSPCWRMAILGWPTYEGHPRTPTDPRPFHFDRRWCRTIISGALEPAPLRVIQVC